MSDKPTTQIASELEEAMKILKDEVVIEVKLPNGNTENMYYKFENLNYKHIESTKLALVIWDEKYKNHPNTLPTLQQTFFEQAGAMGMAMMLYTKDTKGNPIPFTGNINKHRPYELLDYTTGEQYELLTMVRNFFLSKWGVTSFDFKSQFLDTAELLLTSQMDKIEELMNKEVKKKGYTKNQQEEIKVLIKTLLTHSLKNTSPADSSGQSVPDLVTNERTSI